MTDLHLYSATKLAELIRTRHVSPVEVVSAFLKRIDEINPKLNAIVTIAGDAIDRAREAETAIARGDAIGPLHGLPVTVKDTIDTERLRTTSGSALRADRIPEQDAPAVARLKAAGAIVLAKTNTAEMAMDYNGDNPVFPRANNPYDLSRTPGGSSAGEAAAIATCMSPAGIGSDLAGSVRIPAHFCGIAALKPGVARIPGGGQFPPAAGAYSLGSAIGPMARDVSDLQLLFRVLAGSESKLPQSTSGLRVAWYTDDLVSPVTEETRGAVETAAGALADAGLKVEETRPPGVEHGHDLWLKMFSRTSVVLLRDIYAGREKDAGSFVSWRLRTADESPLAQLDDYLHSWLQRDRLRAELIDWMGDFPLFLCPVGAVPALKHDTHRVMVGEQSLSTFRAFSYCQTFNTFDLPAVVIPVGRSNEGLPIGVQIIGRPFEEEVVLEAARLIEESLGGWQIPPAF